LPGAHLPKFRKLGIQVRNTTSACEIFQGQDLQSTTHLAFQRKCTSLSMPPESKAQNNNNNNNNKTREQQDYSSAYIVIDIVEGYYVELFDPHNGVEVDVSDMFAGGEVNGLSESFRHVLQTHERRVQI
jgi:hypothetical protein